MRRIFFRRARIFILILVVVGLTVRVPSFLSPKDVCAQSASPAACTQEGARVLLYDLEPASFTNYWTNGQVRPIARTLAPWITSLGYNFSWADRMSPTVSDRTITLPLLQQYEAVMFYNGCGGPVGLPTQAEVTAIRDYYLAGGHLVFLTDDSVGDSFTGQGDCYSRINSITSHLGVQYAGEIRDTDQQITCRNVFKYPPESSILTDIRQVYFMSASNLSITTPVDPWTTTLPRLIGAYTDEAGASRNFLAYSPAENGHGAILFGNEQHQMNPNHLPACTLANGQPQAAMQLWDNFLDANTDIGLCPSPSPTTVASSSPLSSPNICLNITWTPSNPQVGGNVIFTCGTLAGATRYEFQYRVFNPTTFAEIGSGTLAGSPTAASNTSQPLAISQSGLYKAVCRACVMNNNQEYCSPFETITAN